MAGLLTYWLFIVFPITPQYSRAKSDFVDKKFLIEIGISKTNLQLREQSRLCTEFPFNVDLLKATTKIEANVDINLRETGFYFIFRNTGYFWNEIPEISSIIGLRFQ